MTTDELKHNRPDAEQSAEEGRAERARTFSRRAILKAGWTVPVIAAVALSEPQKALAQTLQCGACTYGDHTDVHWDTLLCMGVSLDDTWHYDRSAIHTDGASHDDFHEDGGGRLHFWHDDGPHYDHSDTHGDYNDPGHTDAGHTDTITTIVHTDHTDTFSYHNDTHLDHSDTHFDAVGYTDVHEDLYIDTHNDGGYTDTHTDTHTDTLTWPGYTDSPYTDRHDDAAGGSHLDVYFCGMGIGEPPPGMTREIWERIQERRGGTG
jgi:hypothetical protein